MLKYHREILKEFEPIKRRAKVILFGSVARGDYTTDSDIDLAIITDDEKIKRMAREIADKVMVEYGKVVSLKFVSPQDFEKKQDPFLKEIKRGVEI